MKTLLVVTFVDFWTSGSGHRSRISTLIGFLQTRVRITVFFAGTISATDSSALRERFPEITLEGAGTGPSLSYGAYSERFGDFIQGRSFDFVLVEYIELSSVLRFLPERTVTLLDTHDLVTDRIRSFQSTGLSYDGIDLTLEEELDIFGCYDYILLIQRNDWETIAQWMDEDRLILAPHPIQARPLALRQTVRNIGFVASGYLPNIEGLEWFLTQVWNDLAAKYHLTLNVYGPIKEAFSSCRLADVCFHGVIDDLESAYRNCDLLINPVRYGAGLKIKSVEALGHGLPLVTTTHGASGMEDGAGSCFLMADTPAGFLGAIESLITRPVARMELGKKAFAYAQSQFSVEKCYEGISQLFD